jgi:hypothetical protein
VEFIGTQPAFGISAKVARGVFRCWLIRKHKYLLSIFGQRQVEGFLVIPSAKRAGKFLTDTS